MHYNLHERIKIKRRIPYKQIFLAITIILVAIVALLWLTNHIPFIDDGNSASPTPTTQRRPA